MSAAVSRGTGRTHGVERVCAVWRLARSSFYAARQASAGAKLPAKRRGLSCRRSAPRCRAGRGRWRSPRLRQPQETRSECG